MGGFEVAEPEVSDADAEELGDLVAERLEHHADLAFRAVVEDDLDAARGDPLDFLCFQLPFLGENAGEELVEVGVLEGLVRGDEVFLFDRFRRVHKALRKIAVIGEDEHALGIGVETPDVMEGVQRGWQEVVNGLPPELIAAGADVAARLVENDDHLLFREDAFAIEADEIRRGDAGSELQAGRAVDLDATGLDQFLTAPPRADAAGGEVFVETDSLGHDGSKMTAPSCGAEVGANSKTRD